MGCWGKGSQWLNYLRVTIGLNQNDLRGHGTQGRKGPTIEQIFAQTGCVRATLRQLTSTAEILRRVRCIKLENAIESLLYPISVRFAVEWPARQQRESKVKSPSCSRPEIIETAGPGRHDATFNSTPSSAIVNSPGRRGSGLWGNVEFRRYAHWRQGNVGGSRSLDVERTSDGDYSLRVARCAMALIRSIGERLANPTSKTP